tara:strand:- start:49 stop:1161 length:1113 start_codon:yes stop_codon:yes gene_type:complete
MVNTNRKNSLLLLEDGTVFEGKSAGISGFSTGELCFNTGMSGYQEVFTDPSYFGQLMITTNAHIGNYGVHKNESESENMKISGLICKNFNFGFSRMAGFDELNNYFISQNKVVITDVDTRAVVRHIRSKGAMNAIISNSEHSLDDLSRLLSDVPSMNGLELSSKVTTFESYTYGNESAKYKIAVLDLGLKKSILNCLTDRNSFCKVFPMNSSYEEIMSFSPDGFLISNGPGDPSSMTDVIKLVKRITHSKKPVFGICLGHQILALSEGISTFKMHNGHRGINHPVKNLNTGLCEITSQNHGFGVNEDDIKKNKNVDITHINLNDGTIEGIKLIDKDCFSVQYHPEASPGPHDSRYLFDDFIIKVSKRCTK